MRNNFLLSLVLCGILFVILSAIVLAAENNPKGDVNSILGWARGVWEKYVRPFFLNIWGKIQAVLRKEIDTRKSGIEQKLEQEKQEVKFDALKAGNDIWQRLKTFFNKEQ